MQFLGPRQLPRLFFQDSPFFTVVAALSETVLLPVMTSNRHSIKTVITLDPTQVLQLQEGKYKVMMYCAALDHRPAMTKMEIAFPHQSEIAVNGKTVTGVNLRGLKNKPGTTRPADLTSYLSLKPMYRNEVMVTYAMTQKVGCMARVMASEVTKKVRRTLDST